MFRAAAGCLAVFSALSFASPRAADACRVLDIELTPSEDLQIVAWLEDSAGNFVETLFITDATGRYGLGNRPGIMEFNTEFGWPYGRRETVFPVWARRHGVSYPKLVFQDGYDRDLSHAFNKSSIESYYCRPLLETEPVRDRSIDMGSCATVAYTDKGKFDGRGAMGQDAGVSLYPPRRDLRYVDGTDHPDVQRFPMINDLDAVSRATPPGGEPYAHAVSLPTGFPDGDYVVWIEVSKERDQNDTYDFPEPALQAYGEYGVAYRGQPSILWKLPIRLDAQSREASAVDYAGYGDPSGLDGDVREPDPTISAGVDGSGARRLLLAFDGGEMYRVRVKSAPSEGGLPPDPPTTMEVHSANATQAEIHFVEPADPNTGGVVRGYDIRYSIGEPLTADNFLEVGRVYPDKVTPANPGALQKLQLQGLVPETRYWVGIRALDDCLSGSAPLIVELTTPRLEPPEVAACFVATAAWGSPLAAEVAGLRGFRDRVLRRFVLGEVLVESYYTFGPALAGAIRPSDTLRAAARGFLTPIARKLTR
jgi:hypothetical protein